jgi:hypothetical protein
MGIFPMHGELTHGKIARNCEAQIKQPLAEMANGENRKLMRKKPGQCIGGPGAAAPLPDAHARRVVGRPSSPAHANDKGPGHP